MQNLKILNKKEIKNIISIIKDQWDADIKLEYAFLINDKGRIFIVNNEFSQIDESKLRINSLGMYFSELKNNELRLSIEGSQLIGPKAKKNVVELNDTETRDWLKGIDLDKETDAKGFVIIKHNSDYIGTGRIKYTRILNFVPKTRRICCSD